MYTIIEDCSPYFVRFTWDGLPELISFIKEQNRDSGLNRKFEQYAHHDFDMPTAYTIINQLPMREDFDFMVNRVGLFISHPAPRKALIHKDGRDHRFSINMLIEVHDECCVTSWWNEEQLSQYNKGFHNPYTRQLDVPIPFPTPAKSMIAQPNECVLFNTDMWHAWENESPHQRVLLTLRVNNPGEMYFDDAKRILFGSVAEPGLLR